MQNVYNHTTNTASTGKLTSVFSKKSACSNFELNNHLGNVLVVVSDKRLPNNQADVVSTTDYYPFGMQMPGRGWKSDGYRYGFGGHEKDDEVKGVGNVVDMIWATGG